MQCSDKWGRDFICVHQFFSHLRQTHRKPVSLCVTKRKLWCKKKEEEENHHSIQSVKGFPFCACAMTNSSTSPSVSESPAANPACIIVSWPEILWDLTANRTNARVVFTHRNCSRIFLDPHLGEGVHAALSWLNWKWPINQLNIDKTLTLKWYNKPLILLSLRFFNWQFISSYFHPFQPFLKKEKKANNLFSASHMLKCCLSYSCMILN